MTFQWRGGYLTREVLQELLELIRKAGEERQKTARISFNWPQAVIHFSYVENAGIPEPEVVMEDANEGEQFDTEIKVWDDVRIKNSPTSMRTPGITH